MVRLIDDIPPHTYTIEDEDEPVQVATHVESGIAGNNLINVINKLELYDGQIITPEERDVIELQLLQSSLGALENFNKQGLLHNHPHTGNFQVGKDGVIHLIDYHKATDPNPNDYKTRDISRDLDQFVWSLKVKDPELYEKAGFNAIRFDPQDSYEAKRNKIEAVLAAKLEEYPSIAVADVMKKLDLVLLDTSLRELGIANLTESELKKVSDEIDIVISEAPTVVFSNNHSQEPITTEVTRVAGKFFSNDDEEGKEVPLKNIIQRSIKRFDTIEPIDYENQQAERARVALDVKHMFAMYLARRGDKLDQIINAQKTELPFKRALSVVIETARECSQVIGIEEPRLSLVDFGEESDALERVVLKDNKVECVEINSRFIRAQEFAFKDLSSLTIDSAKRSLRELTAQEIYHLKIIRDYPQTHLNTLLANTEEGTAYEEDRGESATIMFGQSYARYKMMHNTFPERIQEL